MKAAFRLIICVTAISLGGAVIGIDSGIISTVIAQQSFTSFMFPPGTQNTTSLLGAIVSMGSAGSAIGSLAVGFLLEKLGRKKTLAWSTVATIIGSLMQTVANGVPLMIVGRLIAGIALGLLTPMIPVYVSELARPSERARLVGIFGLILSLGFCIANWIGYACSFAEGAWVWRLELAMQIPVAIVLLILAFFLPESPRWLAEHDRFEEFSQTLNKIYGDEDPEAINRMATEIREQIIIDATQRQNVSFGHALIELFTKKYIRRTAMAIAVLQVGILSGSLAIQNYQSLLYEALGFSGQGILLISGCYGFMGIVGQLINLAGVSDKWPRVRTMWIGCLTLACLLAVVAALSKLYGNGENISGARAGVAFIFLYSATYAVFFNSTLYTIAAEMFPQHLRGYGTGVAALCQGVSGIWMGQITPYAFAALEWKYYLIFISCLLALGALYAFGLEETNRVSLEQVGARYGDRVVSQQKLDIATEKDVPKNVEDIASAA
ncbi:general substrate transporter [Aspergillus cavernicola]|uniref:General substrate transporter n=1 Tax=Aspergillus cavernicola TaxID=176166 RepID=A0ABR4HUW6_9EURO